MEMGAVRVRQELVADQKLNEEKEINYDIGVTGKFE